MGDPLTCVGYRLTCRQSGKQVEYAQVVNHLNLIGYQGKANDTHECHRKTSRSGLSYQAVIDTKEGTMRKYDVEHARLLLESAYIELDEVRQNIKTCAPEDLPQWIGVKNRAIQKVFNLEIKLRDAENSLAAQKESEHGKG